MLSDLDATRLQVRNLDNEPQPPVHRWSIRTGSLTKDEEQCILASEGAIDRRETSSILSLSPRGLNKLGSSSALGRVLAACAQAAHRPTHPPCIMGIVNVTPDSFSDGGRWLDPAAAIEHGLRLVCEGAQVLDIGGESSRPGAAPVDAKEELRRVIPVIEGLAARTPALLSIDTTKANVARAALDAGAHWINDISAGLQDTAMLPLVAERGAVFVAMHRQGISTTMQDNPRYGDCLSEVAEHLRGRVRACLTAGIAPEKIILDPGIGFGKTLEHNIELMGRLRELRSLGAPLMVGPSRKAFIGNLEEAECSPQVPSKTPNLPADRLGGTAAAISLCIDRGAQVFRVHDCRIMAEAARVAYALSASYSPTATA